MSGFKYNTSNVGTYTHEGINYTKIDIVQHNGSGLDLGQYTTQVLSTTVGVDQDKTSLMHTLVYIFVPIGCLLLVGLIVLIAWLIARRISAKKLRGHLIPTYNYDPRDGEPDWETDLLDQDREQQVALRTQPTGGDESPQLRFKPEHDFL